MAKEYSNRLKNFKAHFTANNVDKNSLTPPQYSEQFKAIKAKFTALVGYNFSFTPAVVKIVNGHKCEVYFAYRGIGKKILRPYLKLVTDFNGGTILEFKNAYYDDFANTEKYPLGTEFDATVPTARTAKEQMEQLKTLQRLYAQVRDFAFAENLPDTNKRLLNQYAACLAETVPADLLNFCKETEPKFFAWLDANR